MDIGTATSASTSASVSAAPAMGERIMRASRAAPSTRRVDSFENLCLCEAERGVQKACRQPTFESSLCAAAAKPPLHDAEGFPPAAALLDLVSELEEAHPDPLAPQILAAEPVPRFPTPLGACHEIDLCTMNQLSYVAEQARVPSQKRYVRLFGKREYSGKGHKRIRSKQEWPRTKSDRLRSVLLHRWIAAAVHGTPPTSTAEAAHVCGSSNCIIASHIRWQTKAENDAYGAFHRTVSAAHDVPGGKELRRFSRLEWPTHLCAQG
jgi:hypothetical protein